MGVKSSIHWCVLLRKETKMPLEKVNQIIFNFVKQTKNLPLLKIYISATFSNNCFGIFLSYFVERTYFQKCQIMMIPSYCANPVPLSVPFPCNVKSHNVHNSPYWACYPCKMSVATAPKLIVPVHLPLVKQIAEDTVATLGEINQEFPFFCNFWRQLIQYFLFLSGLFYQISCTKQVSVKWGLVYRTPSQHNTLSYTKT